MKRQSIVLSLLVLVLGIAAGGVGLYQLGERQGRMQSAAPTASTAPQTAAVDPSTWGIAEGEHATRRHIQDGIKAGDTDPMTGRRILYYHDPMVPGNKFTAPAKSPFMDMMLVPAYAGAEGQDPGTVRISPRVQQNLGIRSALVERAALQAEVTAVGNVAWNERGQYAVQARATGFVEKLHVSASLDPVQQGQALFDVYVPEWVAVQEDYLALRRMSGSDLDSLRAAARQRMRQAGMAPEHIALVERSGAIQPRTTLRAPVSGVLTELLAREGSTVLPGMSLARINDLGTVWVQAEVPESQAALLHKGSRVSARTPAWPGEEFGGQLQALLPEVNPMTRTRKARMELANPRGRLVPGMSVHMQLSQPQARPVLVVPTEALIRTGSRTLVMLETEGGFSPAEVKIGAEQGGRTEVLSGLTEGQKVVVSGQFLIDSEASLKGVEARMGAPMEPAPMQAMPTSQEAPGAATAGERAR